MESLPEYPPVDSVPELLSGHLWILEAVDGGPLRFSLGDDGRITFAAGSGPFEEEVPPAYRASVEHVRERFDRAGLRRAVGDPTAVTFLGVATFRRRVDYDFARLPPFVGVEVHDGDRYLEADSVEGIYDRLGLAATPTLDKEVRAAGFDPDRYAVPRSTYRDRPALAALVRNKTGDRGAIYGPDCPDGDLWDESVPTACADPTSGSPEDVAARLVTEDLIDRAADAPGGNAGRAGDFEAVFERTLAAAYREHAHRLAVHGADVDPRAFRSAVAAVVREHLTGE